jgi:hypothetical protein
MQLAFGQDRGVKPVMGCHHPGRQQQQQHHHLLVTTIIITIITGLTLSAASLDM